MLTPDQERAVFAEGSAAVTAAAGTGKTHMLAHRYLYHLRQGFSPLQIVAVTFTERAADELRSRIREEVRRAEGLEQRDTILAELEAAQISTLHALAARICRDHANSAGVPADFRIQDDLEDVLAKAENLEDALATLPSSLFETVPYTWLKTSLRELLKDPIQAERALSRSPSSWAELLHANSERVLADLLSADEWKEACDTICSVQGDETDKLEPMRQNAIGAVECLTRSEFQEAEELFESINLSGGKKDLWPGGKETVTSIKSSLKFLRASYRSARDDDLLTLELSSVDDDLIKVLEVLQSAFNHVRAFMAEKKRDARTLDYADLEVHALQALEHDEVKAHYQDRWRAFLVDEFQDTNPVQEQLLSALTEDAILTIVGDEKQAIYSFRGADVQVFRNFRQRIMSTGGQEEELSESFRTHGLLVKTINSCFTPIFADDYQQLLTKRESAPHEAPHLEAFSVVDPGKSAKRAARQVMEARELGRRIKALIDEGVAIYDKRTDTVRPVELRDIAVLTRTWRPLDIYNEILPAMGVPTAHIGGGNLLETREAQDAWALLRWLAEPEDDIALVAVLRSPYFAVSDPVLYRLSTMKEKGEPWWVAIERSQNDEARRCAAVLSKLRDSAKTYSPSRLLQLADRETGYTAVIANLPGQDRRLADYRGFVDLVGDLERGLGDVFSVVRRLRRLRLAEAQIGRPRLQGQDAVSLMTIHAAKGLEWPVVVVADLDYERPGGFSSTLVDPDLGVALKLDNDSSQYQEPALYKLIKRQQKMREDAELARVMYVAFTRARDRLLLSATAPKGAAYKRLSPGFEAISLAFEQVEFDASLAVYPTVTTPRTDKATLKVLVEV